MHISEYIRSLRSRIGHDLLLLPGTCALVFNDRNEVLLQRRTDTGRWSVIGGITEPGEEPADTVVREVFEETGLRVIPERITGVDVTPVITYPNGDRTQHVVIVFRCRHVAGTPRVNDDESLEVRYFPVDALPELSAAHRQRIMQATSNAPAYFAPPRDHAVV